MAKLVNGQASKSMFSTTSSTVAHTKRGKRTTMKKKDVFGKGFVSAMQEIYKFDPELEYGCHHCQNQTLIPEPDSRENLIEPDSPKKEHRKNKKRNVAAEIRECVEAIDQVQQVDKQIKQIEKVEQAELVEEVANQNVEQIEKVIKNEPPAEGPGYCIEPVVKQGSVPEEVPEEISDKEPKESLARFDVMKIGWEIGGRTQSWTLLLTKIPLPIYDKKPIEALYQKYLRNKGPNKLNLLMSLRNNKPKRPPPVEIKYVKPDLATTVFFP